MRVAKGEEIKKNRSQQERKKEKKNTSGSEARGNIYMQFQARESLFVPFLSHPKPVSETFFLVIQIPHLLFPKRTGQQENKSPRKASKAKKEMNQKYPR